MQKKSLIKSRAAAKKALLASKKTKLGAANKGTKISANAMTENSLSYSAASTRAGLQANAVNSSAAINCSLTYRQFRRRNSSGRFCCLSSGSLVSIG